MALKALSIVTELVYQLYYSQAVIVFDRQVEQRREITPLCAQTDRLSIKSVQSESTCLLHFTYSQIRTVRSVVTLFLYKLFSTVEPVKCVCSTVINKHFLLSCSFFSGVLRGHRGAAVHYLPQGSSVLQTTLLSGATCRYGELSEEKKRERVAFVLSFSSLK